MRRFPWVRAAVLLALTCATVLLLADAIGARAATEALIRRLLLADLPRLPATLARLWTRAAEGHPWTTWLPTVVMGAIAGAWIFSRGARKPIARTATAIAALLTLPVGFGVALLAYASAPTVAMVVHGLFVLGCAWALAVGGERRRAALAYGAAAWLAIDLATVAVPFRAHVRAAAAHTPPAHRFAATPAFDAIVVGDPAALVYTDQAHVFVVRAPYALRPSAPAELAIEPGGLPERLLAATGPNAFYLGASGSGVSRIELKAAPTVTPLRVRELSDPASLAEDPIRRRLFALDEWDGRGAALSLDQPTEPARLSLFDAPWPAPSLSVDATGRRGFATSAALDGSLAVVDLDTLAVHERRPELFLSGSVWDPAHHTLWAVRALPGELLALDGQTLAIRARTPLAPGTQRVVLDPVRHQLFVNTYPFGDLFRIDADTGRVVEVSGCGWRCRSLYLDPQRRRLWTASQDGIYRFSVDEPFTAR